MRRLRAPALLEWRHELRCSDDGVGMDAAAVDRRLGALGVAPDASGQRGLFGRGLRDVWLAQGGGRIEGVHAGRLVESWFFPSGGDDPYAYVHVRDEEAGPAARRSSGSTGGDADHGAARRRASAGERAPAPAGRPARAVAAGARGPERELWLELPGEPLRSCTLPAPEPDRSGRCCSTTRSRSAAGVRARIIVRRAAEPIPLSPSRATRLGGLVVRSGRAAHETTLAGHEGEPGTRHLYGEVICEEIERLQRAALDSPRPQVVVKVDRSGLNEHHPFVQRSTPRSSGPAPDRRRRGAPRRRASGARRPRRAGARPGRAARAQRRAAQRLRRARGGRLRARRPPRDGAGARGARARAAAVGVAAPTPARRRPTRRWSARCVSSSRRCACTRARTAACRS